MLAKAYHLKYPISGIGLQHVMSAVDAASEVV